MEPLEIVERPTWFSAKVIDVEPEVSWSGKSYLKVKWAVDVGGEERFLFDAVVPETERFRVYASVLGEQWTSWPSRRAKILVESERHFWGETIFFNAIWGIEKFRVSGYAL